MADVKAHLKSAHHLTAAEIKNVDNALYTRFQIRASDGLLQRYLEYYWKRDVDNKDMINYWHEGNNIHFLHLLNLVESQFHGIPMSFRIGTMWEQLSSPYCKKLNEQDRDFVVQDDEEIQYYPDTMHESDISVDDNQSCSNPEESLIKELRRRRSIMYDIGKRRAMSLSSDDDDDENDTSRQIVSISPQQKSQLVKRRRIVESESESESDTDEDIIVLSSPTHKLTQILSSDDELTPQRSTAKPRTQIYESDDDDDSNSTPEKLNNNQQIDSLYQLAQILSSDDEVTPQTLTAKPRTQIHESDDDDDSKSTLEKRNINQKIDCFLKEQIQQIEQNKVTHY